jgi:hypothetical protein
MAHLCIEILQILRLRFINLLLKVRDKTTEFLESSAVSCKAIYKVVISQVTINAAWHVLDVSRLPSFQLLRLQLIKAIELLFVELITLVKCMLIGLGNDLRNVDKERHNLGDATSESDEAGT